MADTAQGLKTGRGAAAFLKYWREYNEVRPFARGDADVFFGMAGNGDEPVSGFCFLVCGSEAGEASSFSYRDIVGTKVNAIGADGQSYIAS